ncbi:MAG TPA: phosphatidylglycerophosphatase A [Usitatibacter sp.]|jgi:phosphatidylglycerophosphatase A|nr:phosphatidylglycerophosphatase A [Usitatibacter sp.]
MGADTTTSRVPDARFLVSHPAHFIALGFGAGLIPIAPGTWGTLLSWGLCAAAMLVVPPVVLAFAAIPLFFLGVWACEVTGRDLGVEDHGAMVWDEIVAFMPLAAIASAAWWLQAVAFVLFRVFDVWKPYPIGLVERNTRGGMGVMVDDAMAAAYAYLAFIVFIVVMYKGFGFR